ncbi:MAG: acyl-CoA desaturase [Pseudomonadota bacterium]
MKPDGPGAHITLCDTERILARPGTCNTQGTIKLDLPKALWLACHGGLGVAGVLLFPHWDALAAFLVLTAFTICAGHSVGMHRLLIHRSFEAPRWVEYGLVWLGTCVGMAGPMGMIRSHDMRDWHQRQTTCPAHPAHRASILKDPWWQLCCRYDLDAPPRFAPEASVAQNPVYIWIERTWMLQNIPLALALYALGGWAWVLWGVSLRIFVSLVGHWWIGHVAHRRGQQGWVIQGLPVQGFNVPGWGIVTFGENWHGNHHAFPYSARLGIEPGQTDPGFWFILALKALGLARNVKTPGDAPDRPGLVRVQNGACSGPDGAGMVHPHEQQL